MLNERLDKPHDSIYQCIAKCCLKCKSHQRCPALIVIAMRYTFEVAAPSVRAR